MAEKKTAEALPPEAAARERRWRAALAEAESALASGEAKDAEARAKALSALARASDDIEQWKDRTVAAQRRDMADDGESLLRELQRRFNNIRRARGLEPIPDGTGGTRTTAPD